MAERTGAAHHAIRVLVVDAHDLVQHGMRALLGREPWVARCLPARNAEEATLLDSRFEPHVALICMAIAGGSGLALSAALRSRRPSLRTLILTDGAPLPTSALTRAGASGSVSKEWCVEEILRTVRLAAQGRKLTAAKPNGGEHGLTPRQEDVLQQVALGATNREIGDQLGLSPHTVKQHTQSVYRKLGVHNRAGAVRAAQRLGLLR